jgi:hypothetical protein
VIAIVALVVIAVAIGILWSLPGVGSVWRGAGREGGRGGGTSAGIDCYGLTAEMRSKGWSAHLLREADGSIAIPATIVKTYKGSVVGIEGIRPGCVVVGDELQRAETTSASGDADLHEDQGRSPYDGIVIQSAIQAVRDIARTEPGCAPIALQWLMTYEAHVSKRKGFLGLSAVYRRTRLGALAREMGSCTSGVDLTRFGFKDAQQLVVALLSASGAGADGAAAAEATPPAS